MYYFGSTGINISHDEKDFFCFVREFEMLLYELSGLLPSIFMGPPEVMFGTDALFFTAKGKFNILSSGGAGLCRYWKTF